MLHILWMIIKIILIVIGVVLGLLLLAVLLILFCPVRYQASGKKQDADWKKTQGSAKISWLFHAVSFRIWILEGTTSYSIRLFGLPLDKLIQGTHKKKQSRKKDTTSDTPAETLPVQEETELPDEDPLLSEAETPQDAPPVQEEKKRNSFWKLMQRIRDLPGKIIQKIRNIALTIRNIYAKIDWWKQFINHPKTRSAVSYIWNHAKYLIKHILPTKIQGYFIFGNEDPSVTGMVLALLGTTIPLHKNCVKVTPVFEGKNIAEGEIKLRGRIYGIVLIRAAIEIYLNKNVKYVIRRWRHKEG